MGKELANFHLACKNITKILPSKSKTFHEDIKFIKKNIFSKTYFHFDKSQKIEIIKHCDIFIKNTNKIINKKKIYFLYLLTGISEIFQLIKIIIFLVGGIMIGSE